LKKNHRVFGALLMSIALAACTTKTETPTDKTPAPTAEAPARPPVPKEQWKVKDADSAKTFLQTCEPVKDGSLTLTIEQEATPESPVWWVGLQIPGGPLLDRCSVDAETQKLFCRGDTCP
jgi:cell division protein FtsN